MNVMVAGFDAEATRRLSQELRAAGHMVLGAQGRHGTRTFLHAKVPDVVVVPTEESARVRDWTSDLDMRLSFVEVPAAAPDGRALAALRRFTGEAPEPEPAREPTPTEVPAMADDATSTVIVEVTSEPSFEVLGHRMPPLRSDAFVAWPDTERDAADDAYGEPEPPPLPEASPAPRRARRGVRHDATTIPRPDAAPAGATAPAAPDVAPDALKPGRLGRPASGGEAHPDLVAKLAQVRFADYFQILEVEPSGSPFQARESHERLARRYSPRGWSGRLMPEELDMLDEIARGIADAALVLTDPELRARYERSLGGSGIPRRGP